MAIVIDGTGTITGLSAGGLPDGSITAADLASTLDLTGKTVTLPAGTGGKVLQVVQTVSGGSPVSVTSSTPQSVSFSASITPSATTSKILVLMNPSWAVNSAGGANGTAKGHIYRNGSNVYDTYLRNYDYDTSGLYINVPVLIQYMDSPNTTSSVTYAFYISLTAGSSTTFQSDGGGSTIILMEIGV